MCIVLYTQKNSIYNQLGCDCYDINRDATTYQGTEAVIAHPPCRAWSKLKGQAKPLPGEKMLAISALNVVNTYGGILEHPKASDLWKVGNLTFGKILTIQQKDFGHMARKDTNLYVVGIELSELPPMPITLKQADGLVELLPRAKREGTPIDLAIWLKQAVELINENKRRRGISWFKNPDA